MGTRVNIGCGQSPTEGWENYDNSWSIKLAKKPTIFKILNVVGLLSEKKKAFINFARKSNIKWADAKRHIPEPDHSLEVLYTSHMLEHLDRQEVENFFKEVRRVLQNGGIVRIAVPDIKYSVEQYLLDKDADKLVEKTGLTKRKPKTFFEKLQYLIVGERKHQWMYDGNSLAKLLRSAGFNDPAIMAPGDTMIKDPGPLNLKERSPGTVYVEAMNP